MAAALTLAAAMAVALLVRTGLPDGRGALIRLLEYLSENATLSGAVMLWLAQTVGYLAMLPTSILSVAAGCAYGLRLGLVVGQIGHLCGCFPPFLASRRLIRRRVAEFAAKRPLAKGVMAAVDEQPFTICTLLRMSPAPLPLSYILGLTTIPVRTYLLATALGAFPQLLFSVYLGTLMSTVTEALKGEAKMPWPMVVMGVVAAIVVSAIISTAAKRKIDEATAAATATATNGRAKRRSTPPAKMGAAAKSPRNGKSPPPERPVPRGGRASKSPQRLCR